MIVRQHAPLPGRPYKTYKPFLREDFNFRCAYCEINELSFGGMRSFTVDHFRPKKKFPELISQYGNLYYACRDCNNWKHDHWPGPALDKKGFQFADPCSTDIYGVHLLEQEDGTLECLTNIGRYTFEHVRLDREDLVDWRRERKKALEDIPVVEKMIKEIANTVAGLVLPARKRKQLNKQMGALDRNLQNLKRITGQTLPSR